MTLVQRFGGSANLNIHFHTLMIEGVYREDGGEAFFHPLRAPSNEEVKQVLSRYRKRVVRAIQKRGYAVGRSTESNEPEYVDEGELTLTDLFTKGLLFKTG